MAAFSDGDKVSILKGKFSGKTGEVISFRVRRPDGTVESYDGTSIQPYVEPAPTPGPAGEPVLELSADGKSAKAKSLPVGTTSVKFAICPGDEPVPAASYSEELPPSSSFAGTPANPWVGLCALPAGIWSKRIKTTQTAPAPDPTPGPTPGPAPTPGPTPSPSPTGFELGYGSRDGAGNVDAAAIKTLGPATMRFGVGVDNLSGGTGQYDKFRAMGCLPLPLITFGGVPNDSQVDAVVAWAKARPGVKLVEWGNEDSYSYKRGDTNSAATTAFAEAYARSVKRLGQGLAGSGIGVLCQADDGNSGGDNWVKSMFRAVPDLQNYVAGWVIHPYGTNPAVRINRMYSQLPAAARGIKTYITEWGVPSDNGRHLSGAFLYEGFSRSYTYPQAAVAVRNGVAAMKGHASVKQVLLYQIADQHMPGNGDSLEFFYGLTRGDGSAKGDITTVVRELLA